MFKILLVGLITGFLIEAYTIYRDRKALKPNKLKVKPKDPKFQKPGLNGVWYNYAANCLIIVTNARIDYLDGNLALVGNIEFQHTGAVPNLNLNIYLDKTVYIGEL